MIYGGQNHGQTLQPYIIPLKQQTQRKQRNHNVYQMLTAKLTYIRRLISSHESYTIYSFQLRVMYQAQSQQDWHLLIATVQPRLTVGEKSP